MTALRRIPSRQLIEEFATFFVRSFLPQPYAAPWSCDLCQHRSRLPYKRRIRNGLTALGNASPLTSLLAVVFSCEGGGGTQAPHPPPPPFFPRFADHAPWRAPPPAHCGAHRLPPRAGAAMAAMSSLTRHGPTPGRVRLQSNVCPALSCRPPTKILLELHEIMLCMLC